MATISIGSFNPQTFEEARSQFAQAIGNKAPETDLQKIIDKTVELCRESFFPFIKACVICKGIEKQFFDSVMGNIEKELKTQPLSKRLLYKIEDDKGVIKGYIIGTIHESGISQNEAINNDPIFIGLVKKCRTLVTELGLASYGLDQTLAQTAKTCDKPVLALETEAFQYELARKISQSKETDLETPKQEITERFHYLGKRKDLFKILGLYAYLTGDISELRLIKNMDTAFENQVERDRHYKWINSPITGIPSLSDQLSSSVKTQEPICIAVDAMSLFGDYGFIRLLSQNFSVKYCSDPD